MRWPRALAVDDKAQWVEAVNLANLQKQPIKRMGIADAVAGLVLDGGLTL